MWTFPIFVLLTLLRFSEQTCHANLQADIVFALDSPGSVGFSHFKKQIDFVKDLVDRFSIGSTRTQFSVVTFSDTVNNEISLNKYQNKRRLINAIDNIAYRQGATNTHLALEFVAQNSFLSANGGRSNIKRIVIILTDGKSQIPDETKKAAAQLHLLGAQVVSVGINSGVDILEITRIASEKQNVIRVENFDELSTIETQIQNAACQKTSDTLEDTDVYSLCKIDFWIWILIGFGSCLILGFMFKLCWYTRLNVSTEKRNKRKISSASNEERTAAEKPRRTLNELDF